MNVMVIMEVVIRLVLMKLDLSIVNVLLVINWMMMDRDVQVKYSSLAVACGSIQPLSVIILSFSLYIYLSLSLCLSLCLCLSLSLSVCLCLCLCLCFSLFLSVCLPVTLSLSPDVNECDNNNGGCAHSCHNEIGSYFCKCNTGYDLAVDQHWCYGNYIMWIKTKI